MRDLPKVIWMLWLQGWDRAPRLVRACRQSWEANNPNWTIHCLDRVSVVKFVANCDTLAALVDCDQPPEATSDRLRVALLAQHGGVWADATTYCLRPLDDWLFDVLRSGFFAFDRPGPDRLVSSWFLAAEPGNDLVRRWAEATLEYWKERRQRHHYYWFHYLFGAEYEKDPVFRSVYDNMSKISADGPHYYVPYHDKLPQPLTEPDQRVISGVEAPLLKLTHFQGEYPAGSVVEHLCKRLGL
jgi:hypothetical protein